MRRRVAPALPTAACLHRLAPAQVDTVKDYDLYCHYVAGLVGVGLSHLFASSGGWHSAAQRSTAQRGWGRQDHTLQPRGALGTGRTSCDRDAHSPSLVLSDVCCALGGRWCQREAGQDSW